MSCGPSRYCSSPHTKPVTLPFTTSPRELCLPQASPSQQMVPAHQSTASTLFVHLFPMSPQSPCVLICLNYSVLPVPMVTASGLRPLDHYLKRSQPPCRLLLPAMFSLSSYFVDTELCGPDSLALGQRPDSFTCHSRTSAVSPAPARPHFFCGSRWGFWSSSHWEARPVAFC